MRNPHALQWELYGSGGAVFFSALRHEAGFDLQLRRDNALVLSDVAPDIPTLLRKSTDLRHHLVRLGFAVAMPEGVDGWATDVAAEPAPLFQGGMLKALR